MNHFASAQILPVSETKNPKNDRHVKFISFGNQQANEIFSTIEACDKAATQYIKPINSKSLRKKVRPATSLSGVENEGSFNNL